MRGKHKQQKKKDKTTGHISVAEVISDTLSQQHPDNKEERDMQNPTDKPKSRLQRALQWVRNYWRVDLAILLSALALIAYFQQACIMRQTLRIDQRAWIIPTITIDTKIEKG